MARHYITLTTTVLVQIMRGYRKTSYFLCYNIWSRNKYNLLSETYNVTCRQAHGVFLHVATCCDGMLWDMIASNLLYSVVVQYTLPLYYAMPCCHLHSTLPYYTLLYSAVQNLPSVTIHHVVMY